MYSRWIQSIFAACFLGILCLMPAVAQDQPSAEAAKLTYGDEELRSFIFANAGLYQVQQQAMTHMKAAESDQQKQEIMDAANQQMLQVLEQVGFTPDSYNAMGQTIQSDVQLQEKVRAIATELAQQEAPQ
ncbi:MAG: DUF4168 domain-containing protein [Nitrosomonas sp.]|nr:DUF4168 domain-containing protein [Nitrosomonas sp.]